MTHGHFNVRCPCAYTWAEAKNCLIPASTIADIPPTPTPCFGTMREVLPQCSNPHGLKSPQKCSVFSWQRGKALTQQAWGCRKLSASFKWIVKYTSDFRIFISRRVVLATFKHCKWPSAGKTDEASCSFTIRSFVTRISTHFARIQ